jgi:L-arabinokinase
MKKIAYYISAHGYGHGARSCDILNALHAAAPEARIIVKTDLPVDFMRSRIPDAIEVRPGAFDVGLIQQDSIRVDLAASLTTLGALYAREEDLILQEMDFIRKEQVGLVVADIPAIPLAAAQRAGIPNIACGNFGWDWIYAEFAEHDPRWQLYVDKFRAVYEQTDLLLRQPFSEPMSAFLNQINLSLLAKPGKNLRESMATLCGADRDKQWVLLSFTSLNLEPEAFDRLTALDEYEFFSVEPLAWPNSTVHCISRSAMRFADIMASVDLVLTKPGFGILSECIANQCPIIYSDRTHFREYPILVECIGKYCTQAFIPNAELYSGRLERALSAIQTAPKPTEKIAGGGAEQAAREMLKQLTARN